MYLSSSLAYMVVTTLQTGALGRCTNMMALWLLSLFYFPSPFLFAAPSPAVVDACCDRPSLPLVPSIGFSFEDGLTKLLSPSI